MSRSIFIQNSDGLQASDGDVNNPSEVADGKVVLLGIDGEGQVGLGGGAGDAPARFHIIRGVENGLPRRSGIINRKDIEHVLFEEFEDAQPQVTTITFAAGTEDNAGTLSLKLTRLDQGFEQYPRVNYEVEVEDGDTPTEIADKFRAAIEASRALNPQRHFVEATGTATLILTAQTIPLNRQGTTVHEFASFVTGLSGEAANGADVVATESPSRGTGTYPQVREYENQSFGNMGFYYTETAYDQRPEHHSQSGVDYDLLTIGVRTNADMAVNKSFMIHWHVIALPAGEMDEATVLALFGDAPDESPSPS